MTSRAVTSAASNASRASGDWCAAPMAACACQCAREEGVRLRRWRYRATGHGTTPRTLILCTSTGVMDTPTLWHLDGGPHTAVYITTASCPSTGAVACLAVHRVRLHHEAPSGQRSHPSRPWVARTDGRRVTGPVSAASGPADTPSAVGGHTTVVDPCDGQRASVRRGGPSFTLPHAPGLVPGHQARQAAPCLRCGPCARGARLGAGPCTATGQTSPDSHPAIAALRRGGSVAAAQGSPGGGPVGARAALSGGRGVWVEVAYPGVPLSSTGRATRCREAHHRPERSGPRPGRQDERFMLIFLS
jgi:hypothetical protein